MKTNMVFTRGARAAVVVGLLFAARSDAGWLDQILGGKSSGGSSNLVSKASALTTGEIASGLKEALAKGVEKAVSSLGQTNGFLGNVDVKIPMPEKLADIEKGLRMMKQDKYADEFVATMNHAAEAAVPEASAIIGDAIRSMTIEDAKNILNGPDDAATQYFRKAGEPRLREKFLPIVKQATEKAGVTAAYKKLTGKAGFMADFLKKENLDVDKYVTDKALDGLFKMVAVEEKEIRKNPMARTTDLLKKVFGSVTGK
jgi:hypothetical protein